MIEPLRIALDLECDTTHAFETWAQRFGQWWPRGHTMSGEDTATVHLEPRLGGRIFERTGDGREIEWGEITVWEPPVRLAYRWHIRRERVDATDVELTFVDRGHDRSRLEIVHCGWERLADGPAWRDANRGGWTGLLPHFAAACSADDQPDQREER